MPGKRIAFQTFGCKLNFAESSTIARDLRARAYEIVGYRDKADVYVINSCLVTAQAEKKCRAAIRQAKKRNPGALVAVVGCFSQLRGQELANMDEVDLVLGNDEKFGLHHFLHKAGKATGTLREAGDIGQSRLFVPSWSEGDRTRSFLKVQDGCDYFCSYCSIPHARGRSRSARIADTMEAARSIIAEGVKEIVITGVNIGDFGRQNGESFYQLLHELDKLGGIGRIRLSSIEPDLLDERIIRVMADSGRLLPHFHIPLQSGSDRILRAMNRKYDTGIFADRVEKIRKLIPLACIATDVITGFPGEGEADFSDTCRFLEGLDISYMHVFTYSARPGTAAAKFDHQTGNKIKKERSHILHLLSEEKKKAFYLKNVNTGASVLFESDNSNGHMHGFTRNYVRVKTAFDPALINQIADVKLINMDEDGVFII
jgi:threonylcarbamoyladenosine tRNA methylthiotransferase MtaB